MVSILSTILGGGFLVSELGLAIWRRAARTDKGKNADAGSLRLLWIVISASIFTGIQLAVNGVGPRFPAGFPWSWAGAGVFALGAVLRWWAIWHLGRFFTVNVSLAADHRVIDTGPYHLIRHPSYTGLLLQFAGFGLTLGTLSGWLVVVVPSTLALLHRIRVEERALNSHLGAAYANYAARTKKLLPMVY